MDGRATATVENRGEVVLPATVEFRFADGSAERVTLPAEAFMLGPTAAAQADTNGRRVVSARLDPDGHLPDDDRTNDTAQAR